MLGAYVHNSKLKNATIRMVFQYWVTNHCINSNQNKQAQLRFTRDVYLDGVMDDLTASNK